MAKKEYKEYQFNVIRDDLSVYKALKRIWASTPRNALNMFCMSRYGSTQQFHVVRDNTVFGCHANTNDKMETIEIR